MTHYLALNGTSAAEALVIVEDDRQVSPTAQALANRLGQPILAYIQVGDSHWPDETFGDWGTFDPRPQ